MNRPRPVQLFGAVLRPLQAFLKMEAAGGVVLLAAAAVAMLWANLDGASYHATFELPLAVGIGAAHFTFSLHELVNDGLMAIFFFVVGMEIKRELVSGELASFRRAVLPAVAALFGMAVPAGIFLAFNAGGAGQHGWGIPMATDIAFCVGLLALLRGRVAHALVVFLTALAIFDDVGGILVIAFFYGSGVHFAWLALAALVALLAFAANRLHVVNGLVYAALGVALWWTLHHAGIHATIAGVVLGLAIPARASRRPREVLDDLAHHLHTLERKAAAPDEELEAAEILAIEEQLEDLEAPVVRFVHLLHPFVAFGIMPVFALGNSGVSLAGTSFSALLSPVALGTSLGLVAGKGIGIFGATLVATKAGLAPMPGASSASKLLGVSILAGIGFTVALFIATLAFRDDEVLLREAKLGILLGSVVAGVAGYAVLRWTR